MPWRGREVLQAPASRPNFTTYIQQDVSATLASLFLLASTLEWTAQGVVCNDRDSAMCRSNVVVEEHT